MKILHVIDSGGLYGAEIMLLGLMAEQVRQGLAPVLASIGEPTVEEKPLEAEARKRGLPMEIFRMRPGPNYPGAMQIIRFARKQGADVLHSHGYKGNILLGLLPRHLRRLPMVSTVHGWTSSGRWQSRMAVYEALDGLSLHCIDRVVVVNEGMLDHPRLRGRLACKVLVVNNGLPQTSVPAADIDPEILRFCQQGPTLGAIGRLSPEKGFDVLLQAFALCRLKQPQARLLILGEGGERRLLETLVKELGLSDWVLMPGYRPGASAYLPLLRGLVLSSHTEGLPMVLLEAMQAGIPIAATAVGGIPSVLDHGDCGLLVPAGEPEPMADAMAELLDPDEDCHQRRQRAEKRAREKYSSQAMANAYLEIYRSLA